MCPGCNELVPIVNEMYWPHWATRIEQVPPLRLIVDLWPCEGSGLPMRACRVCGCTELDCARCIVKTGKPCSWVEDDLCSACSAAAPFADLSAQASGNDFLHGLADLSGDPRLKKLAEEGGVAWATAMRIEGGDVQPVEFRREILGEILDKEDDDAGTR